MNEQNTDTQFSSTAKKITRRAFIRGGARLTFLAILTAACNSLAPPQPIAGEPVSPAAEPQTKIKKEPWSHRRFFADIDIDLTQEDWTEIENEVKEFGRDSAQELEPLGFDKDKWTEEIASLINIVSRVHDSYKMLKKAHQIRDRADFDFFEIPYRECASVLWTVLYLKEKFQGEEGKKRFGEIIHKYVVDDFCYSRSDDVITDMVIGDEIYNLHSQWADIQKTTASTSKLVSPTLELFAGQRELKKDRNNEYTGSWRFVNDGTPSLRLLRTRSSLGYFPIDIGRESLPDLRIDPSTYTDDYPQGRPAQPRWLITSDKVKKIVMETLESRGMERLADKITDDLIGYASITSIPMAEVIKRDMILPKNLFTDEYIEKYPYFTLAVIWHEVCHLIRNAIRSLDNQTSAFSLLLEFDRALRHLRPFPQVGSRFRPDVFDNMPDFDSIYASTRSETLVKRNDTYYKHLGDQTIGSKYLKSYEDGTWWFTNPVVGEEQHGASRVLPGYDSIGVYMFNFIQESGKNSQRPKNFGELFRSFDEYRHTHIDKYFDTPLPITPIDDLIMTAIMQDIDFMSEVPIQYYEKNGYYYAHIDTLPDTQFFEECSDYSNRVTWNLLINEPDKYIQAVLASYPSATDREKMVIRAAIEGSRRTILTNMYLVDEEQIAEMGAASFIKDKQGVQVGPKFKKPLSELEKLFISAFSTLKANGFAMLKKDAFSV